MSDRSRYQRTFSALHASRDYASEVREMTSKESGKSGIGFEVTRRAAAIGVAACLMGGGVAYAAVTHAGLFDDLFGTGFRQSEPATQVVQDQGGAKPDVTVTLPAKDYVDVDPEAAEELLGAYVSDEPVVVESADGHTLTIDGVVRSDSALLYRFTLEREGGQTALVYDEVTNRTKGAYATPESTMGWFVAGDEFRYVDLDASTDERVVGYAYCALDGSAPAGQALTGRLWERDSADAEEDGYRESTFEVPCAEVVPASTFANTDGGKVEVSPLGVSLDNRTGLFAEGPGDYSMAEDPVWTRKVVLSYEDGTSYVVFDADADIDNTSSICEFEGANLVMVFNRLVDPARVASVEVTVVDCPSGNPDDLLVDGDWPAAYPERIVTYQL